MARETSPSDQFTTMPVGWRLVPEGRLRWRRPPQITSRITESAQVISLRDSCTTDTVTSSARCGQGEK